MSDLMTEAMEQTAEWPNECREAFKKWSQERKYQFMTDWKDGSYIDYGKTDAAWEAWKACWDYRTNKSDAEK